MRRTLLSLGFVSVCVAGPAIADTAARDPSGEMADYMLDKDAARTSSVVQSGMLSGRIVEPLTDAGDGPGYLLAIDYTLKIFGSTYQGSECVEVPSLYFSPDFMVKLRETKHYETAKFKVDHKGFGNAHTLDGHDYPNADRIFIYDITTSDCGSESKLPWDLPRLASEIEDLTIAGYIYQGIPVLGAVKVDIAGKYSGLKIRAGADYKTP